jgi:hypothetical protein
MKVENAGRGLVVDAPFRISVELAQWMKATLQIQGFVRCAPHAGGWAPDWLDVLTEEELRELTSAGFGVTVYQIFRGSRQRTAEQGQAAGEALVEHCRSICLPDGVTLWCDCESFRDDADVTGYIDAWRKRAAYISDSRGVYVGSGFLLPDMHARADAREQGDRLWGLSGINRYWLSLSQVYTPSVRGCCLDQAWEYVLHGSGPDDWRVEEYRPNDPAHKGTKRFDINASRRDSLGGRMRWATS